MDKKKLVESFESLNRIAGSIDALYKALVVTDNDIKYDNNVIRYDIRMAVASVFLLRVVIFEEEYTSHFNNAYVTSNKLLSGKIKGLRKVLKTYDIKNVRNWVIAHNRKNANNKPPSDEELKNLKVPNTIDEYKKIDEMIKGVMEEIVLIRLNV